MTQHKSERKNNRKTAVIVALLLALVALLCFGGYTFSKYVTSGSGTGTAQVAKWGYTIEVNGGNLFGKNYKFDGGASKVTEDTGDTKKLTVKAGGDYNVIAPGTTGSITFKVTGQAEVKALVSVGINEAVHNEGIKDVVLKVQKTGGEEIVYNPVKWTLTKNGNPVDGATNTTLTTIAGIISSDPVNGAKAAGTVLDETYVLSWAWAFEGTEHFAGITVNELDTILGRCAYDADYNAYGDWTINEVGLQIKFAFVGQVSQSDR